jgi:DNA-binding CsgD family transcriptional regulator
MKDPIRIVEAIYALTGDEQQWVAKVAETLLPQFVGGRGILAYTYDVSRPEEVRIRSTVMHDWDPAFTAIRPQVELPRSDDRFLVQILRTGFVDMLGRSAGALRRTGLPDEKVRVYKVRLERAFKELKLADEYWVNAQDPTYLGCCFIVPSKTRKRFLPREAVQWRCVAAHVSSAFRIRRQLAAVESKTPELSGHEAILRPDGQIEHAEKPARSKEARSALRRAVMALDKARGPLRRRDPERAMALWQAMVEGRWSLVDHFDSDGRRFVVAHRNDASVPDMRGLTLRERQVAAYAALGHANKLIAYELGLSLSTVGEHLASARVKLGTIAQAVRRASV